MDNSMTFTVTAYDKSVTITQREDLDIHEFLNTCRHLALAMEYHHESWDDAITSAAGPHVVTPPAFNNSTDTHIEDASICIPAV